MDFDASHAALALALAGVLLAFVQWIRSLLDPHSVLKKTEEDLKDVADQLESMSDRAAAGGFQEQAHRLREIREKKADLDLEDRS